MNDIKVALQNQGDDDVPSLYDQLCGVPLVSTICDSTKHKRRLLQKEDAPSGLMSERKVLMMANQGTVHLTPLIHTIIQPHYNQQFKELQSGPPPPDLQSFNAPALISLSNVKSLYQQNARVAKEARMCHLLRKDGQIYGLRWGNEDYMV